MRAREGGGGCVCVCVCVCVCGGGGGARAFTGDSVTECESVCLFHFVLYD